MTGGTGRLTLDPFLSYRFQIYSNQSALESLAVSWEWLWVGPGLGADSSLQKPTTHACDAVFFFLQLIPLQTPLKTLLQIGVMPMLNGRG